MTEEEIRNLPADYPCMVFAPGRYYLAMFIVPFAAGTMSLEYGGDITGLLWRYENEPGTWHLISRTRRYIDASGSPDALDKKSWFHVQFTGDEAFADKKLKDLLKTWEARSGTSDTFEIRGDAEKWFQLVKDGKLPDWLHAKFVTAA